MMLPAIVPEIRKKPEHHAVKTQVAENRKQGGLAGKQTQQSYPLCCKKSGEKQSCSDKTYHRSDIGIYRAFDRLPLYLSQLPGNKNLLSPALLRG